MRKVTFLHVNRYLLHCKPLPFAKQCVIHPKSDGNMCFAKIVRIEVHFGKMPVLLKYAS